MDIKKKYAIPFALLIIFFLSNYGMCKNKTIKAIQAIQSQNLKYFSNLICGTWKQSQLIGEFGARPQFADILTFEKINNDSNFKFVLQTRNYIQNNTILIADTPIIKTAKINLIISHPSFDLLTTILKASDSNNHHLFSIYVYNSEKIEIYYNSKNFITTNYQARKIY